MSPMWGSRTRKPKARSAELLVEELGDEVLVYDQRSNHVHCLSSAARRVWRACDGKTGVEELGSGLDLDSKLVARALDELEACGLLEDEAAGVTRREAATRFAKIGAAAAAAPLIYSIAAPTPALAATIHTCFNALGGSCPSSGQQACGPCAPAGCSCCVASPSPQCTLCVPDCTGFCFTGPGGAFSLNPQCGTNCKTTAGLQTVCFP